jgi:uncharacterized protein YpuA (DUF1002 family)
MSSRRILQALAVSSALPALFLATAVATGEMYAVYGADTTPAQRQQLAPLLGTSAPVQTDTVSTPEMVNALAGSGLPVSPTDRSISSSALTCLEKGDGLTVRTQNITRLTPLVYANALLTAGVGDGAVSIAAPPDDPVTGETALVGVLKAFPQCQAGKPADQARVGLAYKQIAWTVDLAGPNGNLDKASAMLLNAQQPIVAGQAANDGAIAAALDSAASAANMAVDPSLRPALIAFLRTFNGIDYGAYAKGYSIEQASPAQVKLVPAGARAPAVPAQVASQRAGGNGHEHDWWKWLVPLLVFLGSLTLVPLLAARGHQPGFILEPNTPNEARIGSNVRPRG